MINWVCDCTGDEVINLLSDCTGGEFEMGKRFWSWIGEFN